MSRRRRSLGAFVAIASAVAGLLAGSPPSSAADRALLVAASNYPSQPLQGPANDAALLYHALRGRGIEPGQIRLLADGLPRHEGDPVPSGPPTRAAILAAFDQLAKESRPGDTVFIAMSGHGTQAPARDPANEPDGLDELFLPIDVGRWDEARGELNNALRDDEIGDRLDRITAAGAFVWILIDSCHSGTATRAVGGRSLRARFVRPEDLGIPAVPTGSSTTGSPLPAIAHEAADNVVAFYAAQANEVAYETELPADAGGGAEPHGVLSFFVAETLARRPDASYLEIAQAVRAGYDRLAGAWPRFPTPLFEGALDRGVFGATGAPVDAWPARRDGAVVRVAAGSLHGLSKGDEVVLYSSQSDGREPVAGGVVSDLGLIESELSVDESAVDTLPSQLVARAAFAPRPPPLRVARPAGSSAIAQELSARLGEQLASRPDIELVEPSAAADLELAITDQWVALTPAGTSVADTLSIGATQVPLDVGAEEIATRLAAAITARAPTFRLLTLAADFVGTPAARDLAVELHLLRDPAGAAGDPARLCQRPPPEPPAAAETVPPASTPELFHCDTLYVSLEARGRAPIDIGLFFIDSTGAVVALPGPSPFRLERKAPPITVPLTATTWDWQRSSPSTVGLERLVILGVRRTQKVDQAYQADFVAALGLAGPGTRALTATPDAAGPFLGLLGPDGGERRRSLRRSDPREDGFMHIIRWQTTREQS